MKNGFPESREEFFNCLVDSIVCKYCRFREVCNKVDETGDGRRTDADCKRLLMKAFEKAEEGENDI